MGVGCSCNFSPFVVGAHGPVFAQLIQAGHAVQNLIRRDTVPSDDDEQSQHLLLDLQADFPCLMIELTPWDYVGMCILMAS